MTITITSPGEYVAKTKDVPKVGRSYALDDLTTGTGAQNRAFHSLLTEYWTSGAHSYNAKTFDEFRDKIKRSLGAGAERYLYVELVDGLPVIRDVKKRKDIPAGTPPELCRQRLKSWSKYTKTERTDTIDRLIAEMHQAGVNSDKFQQILEGMEAR
jgi:hypothetical protein